MAEDLRRLATLVHQRAAAIEATFARFRARAFPTYHFGILAKFPQDAAREIRTKGIPSMLKDANRPNVRPTSVARMLRRYGQALEFVHESLDFVVNAEVLSIPVPFVLLLEQLGSALLEPRLVRQGEPRLVLQGAPLFNYSFSSIAQTLNQPLIQAGLKKRLPDNFAVFRFPAALREDGLQHAILAHELGHYIDTSETLYRQAWLDARPSVRERVLRFIKTQMGTTPKGLDDDRVRALVAVYANWIIETVCDIFGARVLGPAYLFSSAEFVRFRPELTSASDTHPPSATRLWLIHEELRSLGWGPELENLLDFEITEPLQWTAAAVRALPEAERASPVLERCLRELLPAIRRVVRTRTGVNAYRKADYSKYSETLTDLLAHYVPPGERAIEGREPQPIEPRAILNAAWFFHLQGYRGWAELRGDEFDRAYDKRQLLSRLVLKALEISYLVEHWARITKGQAK